jgi:hypothetical protein
MAESNVIEFIPADEFEEMGETLGAMSEAARENVVLPRVIGRKRVTAAFLDAFEMIGGVNRLAYWGHENPTEFYKLFGKLLPSASAKLMDDAEERVIKHVIPPTDLDG